MKFIETSKIYSLNKNTYINLRWIAYLGQIAAIIIVQFVLNFDFNYKACILIIFSSILSNIYLKFKIKENQLKNITATSYLIFDILQLGVLLYLTGGITNPFVILIIIPSIFSAQYLKIRSSIILVLITVLVLIFITFFYYDLPHPDILHFHVPNYYLYSIPLSIFIGLIFLVYFGVKFGEESRIRKRAYDKMQEMLAKENELLSLGGQAAASAHSLGTPLSTILLIATELKGEFKNNTKIKNDLELLVSQSKRCKDILKKLSLNPTIEDEFINKNASLKDYIEEIVRSFKEISNKEFIIYSKNYINPSVSYKSSEILYGLRNFIGNANKFSKNKVEIFMKNNKSETEIVIKDDGPGFPKDLIDKERLGEPYIRTKDSAFISKYGLGLGTFIGKTLLEKNYAKIIFQNSKKSGAEVVIKWNNKELSNI